MDQSRRKPEVFHEERDLKFFKVFLVIHIMRKLEAKFVDNGSCQLPRRESSKMDGRFLGMEIAGDVNAVNALFYLHCIQNHKQSCSFFFSG